MVVRMPKTRKTKTGAKVVNPRFAKGKEYRNVINTIGNIGHCPFCPENFKYHKKPILRKLNGWILTENSWPYKNAKKHFIIISEDHKEILNDLKPGDLENILRLSRWAIRTYSILGGALMMRFGESDYTGATVTHLHAHLIYPSIAKNGKSKTVNFPVG